MNINYIVDYNANLFYLVNCWSKWSIDVNEAYYDYFAAKYNFTDKDETLLQKFKDIRIKNDIDWDEEANLMDWASKDFPENRKFNELRDIVKHFERIVVENGIVLKDFINEQITSLENIKEILSLEYKNLKADILLEKLSLLNPEYRNMKDVECYLVFGIDEEYGQAGGNGGEMVCEISTKAGDREIKRTASTLIHEYIHIAVNIKTRLFKDKQTKDFFGKEIKELPTRYYADLFDELLAYSTCNTLFDFEDAKAKVERYSKFDQQIYKEAVFYWKHVDEFGEIVKSYMEDRISAEECYNTLIKQYLSYIPD